MILSYAGKCGRRSTRTKAGATFYSFLLLSALFLGACNREGHTEPDTSRVSLPPVPRIDFDESVERWPDGSLSVSAALQSHPSDDVQTFRGFVHDAYRCENDQSPPGVPTGEELAGCSRPHFYLVDTLGSDERILVTGVSSTSYEEGLVEGLQLRLSAVLSDEAQGFVLGGARVLVMESWESLGLE